MGFLSNLIFRHTCPNCDSHKADVLMKNEYDVNSDESLPEQGEFEICRCKNRFCDRFYISGEHPIWCHRCGGNHYMLGVYLDESGHFGVYCKNCKSLPRRMGGSIVNEDTALKYEYYNFRFGKSTLINELSQFALYGNYYMLQEIWDARGHYKMKRTQRVILLW